MLVDHISADHLRPIIVVCYGQPWNLSLPLSRRSHVLVREEEATDRHWNVFLASVGEPGAATAVSLVCVRADGAAVPQFSCSLSVELSADDKRLTMESPVSSSSLSGGAPVPVPAPGQCVLFLPVPEELMSGDNVPLSVHIDKLEPPLLLLGPPFTRKLQGKKIHSTKENAVTRRHLILGMLRLTGMPWQAFVKVSKGESRDKLDDATLRKEYPPARLEMEGYFKHYEKDGTLDWYFDPCYSKFADLGDYQRLVLKENGVEYLSWKDYHSNFTSYEMDRDYVKYHEEISNKIQWIKRYMKYDRTSLEWTTMSCRGAHQAFKIAASYRHMTLGLAHTAYEEHLWSLYFDYWYCEDMDRLFFEIWKRVAKQKMAFRNALEEVHHEKLVPRHINYTEYALEDNSWSDLKPNFEKCIEGIPDDATEDEAQESIKLAVWKCPKPKMQYQYMMKKMEIVQNIGLDPQA